MDGKKNKPVKDILDSYENEVAESRGRVAESNEKSTNSKVASEEISKTIDKLRNTILAIKDEKKQKKALDQLEYFAKNKKYKTPRCTYVFLAINLIPAIGVLIYSFTRKQ
ncbi:hypothetical protein ENBRE01_2586 [Enteropsectra breve]|nr:hypothetical protein ENBRE01_2586 [Enteropsectra breve]